MTLYAVLFEDEERHASSRAQHMDAHLAFLAQNAGCISAAGPLFDTGDDSAAGGLWLVEAAGLADVRALVEKDPFWPAGLRKSVRILQWRQVFAGGKQYL